MSGGTKLLRRPAKIHVRVQLYARVCERALSIYSQLISPVQTRSIWPIISLRTMHRVYGCHRSVCV